jgi:hypothetical protein
MDLNFVVARTFRDLLPQFAGPIQHGRPPLSTVSAAQNGKVQSTRSLSTDEIGRGIRVTDWKVRGASQRPAKRKPPTATPDRQSLVMVCEIIVQ